MFIYVWRTDASSLRVSRKKDKYEGGDIPSRAHLSSTDNLDNTLLCILFADGDRECDLYIIGRFCLFVCLSVTKNDHFAQRSQIEFFSGFHG